MKATRDHPAWQTDSLHPSFEELLASYTTSIGGSQAVPSEILQSVTKLTDVRGAVTLQGQANCTDGVDPTGDEEEMDHE